MRLRPRPKAKSTLDNVRAAVYREFCVYAAEHPLSLNTANTACCVPADVFFPLVAYAVKRDLNQQLSRLYVDSVLYNAGVQTLATHGGDGSEEVLYVTSTANLQRLLTL